MKHLLLIFIVFQCVTGFSQNDPFAPLNSKSTPFNFRKVQKSKKNIPIIVIPRHPEDINFTAFLEDSSNSENADKNAEDFYDDDSRILSHKIYYNANKLKLKCEFFRIDSMRFKYVEYDTINRGSSSPQFLAVGTVKLTKKPYYKKVDTLEVYNIDAEVTRLEVRVSEVLGLERSGMWWDYNDSIKFCKGMYEHNIREGIWEEGLKSFNKFVGIQREFTYNKGVIVKTDTLDKAFYESIQKKWLLGKCYGINDVSFYNLTNQSQLPLFKSDSITSSKIQIQFYNNNTCKFKIQPIINSVCNWEIEGKLLTIKDGDRKWKFKILTLTNEYLVIEML